MCDHVKGHDERLCFIYALMFQSEEQLPAFLVPTAADIAVCFSVYDVESVFT